MCGGRPVAALVCVLSLSLLIGPRSQAVHFTDQEINTQGDFSKVTGWEVPELRPEMQGSGSGSPQPLGGR